MPPPSQSNDPHCRPDGKVGVFYRDEKAPPHERYKWAVAGSPLAAMEILERQGDLPAEIELCPCGAKGVFEVRERGTGHAIGDRRVGDHDEKHDLWACETYDGDEHGWGLEGWTEKRADAEAWVSGEEIELGRWYA